MEMELDLDLDLEMDMEMDVEMDMEPSQWRSWGLLGPLQGSLRIEGSSQPFLFNCILSHPKVPLQCKICL